MPLLRQTFSRNQNSGLNRKLRQNNHGKLLKTPSASGHPANSVGTRDSQLIVSVDHGVS
jgi:hypothetical protein